MFLADLSSALKDVNIANFADDNTPYTSAKSTDELIESLKKLRILFFSGLRIILSKLIPLSVT